MGKLITVSGCPRSGTSLMMLIMKEALGEDRIVGVDFPSMPTLRKLPSETEEQYELRKIAWHEKYPSVEADHERRKDLNPNGFWECQFTVGGAHRSLKNNALLDEIEASEEDKVCKIVSQGISRSEAQFIDRIVLMARHPRAVAKSQERLSRRLGVSNPKIGLVDLWGGIATGVGKVHTPKMFIEVTIGFALWYKENPDVPLLIVQFDDLIDDAENTLATVQDFVNDGYFAPAASLVDPDLNRSIPEDGREPDLMAEADEIYDMLLAKDWDGIIAYSNDPKTEHAKQTRQWLCLRSGIMTQRAFCVRCQAGVEGRLKIMKLAREQNIPWESRPCAFECGYDVESTPISIEESVANNHWKVR